VFVFASKRISSSDRELLSKSELFDPAFYLDQYRDVAAARADPIRHYLKFGAREGRRPHYAFDGDWYLRKNPDVRREGWNPLVHYLRRGAAEGRRVHKRTVVYTAITGRWDDLRAPLTADSEIDYIVFADEHLPEAPAPWLRLPIRPPYKNDRVAARFYKLKPHVHLPEYEISLWVDGAFQLRQATQELLDLLGDAPVAAFRHPERNCAYAECEAVVKLGLETKSNVDNAVRKLSRDGFPAGLGLYETGLLFRRHRDPHVIAAMEEWWNLVSDGCSRDQVSFNFCLWKHKVTCFTLPGMSRRNRLAYWMGHRPKNEADFRTRLHDQERQMLYLYELIEKGGAEQSSLTPVPRLEAARQRLPTSRPIARGRAR
jgi:O-antigen biosynthesis protein